MQDSCHVPHTAVLSVWSVERLNHSWHRALVFSIIFPTASWAGNWFTSVGKMKWTKSGVSLLGGNFTSWRSFISCICFKGFRWLLWKLQHKWDLGSLFALTGPGSRLLSGLMPVQTACVQRCNSRLVLWSLFVSEAARPGPTFGFLHFYSLLLCVFVVEPISHASDLSPASREPCSGKPAERCYLPAGGLRRSPVQRRSTQTGSFVARGTGDWKTHDF